jgi:coenzyme F420 hydrogenase subunit beta
MPENLSFYDLEYDVVDAGLCHFCGTCAGVCPRIEVNAERERPELIEYCTDCGMCYTYCPRTEYPKDEIHKQVFGTMPKPPLGEYRKIYTARDGSGGQSGGVASELLEFLIETGEIDSAIVTEANVWKPYPEIVTDKEGVLRARGSKYTMSPNVRCFRDTREKMHVGFVGLPCQIRAVRKVQLREKLTDEFKLGGERVRVLIGLFCRENFKLSLIEEYLKEKFGITAGDVKKFDVDAGMWLVHTDTDSYSAPLKEVRQYVFAGCHICPDFTCELADISLGSVGSEKGWNTVIIRTPLGEEFFNALMQTGRIEVSEEVNLEPIIRLGRQKIEKSRANILKRKNEGLRVPEVFS